MCVCVRVRLADKLAVALQSAQAKVALLTQQLDSTQLSGNEWQQKSEQHRLQLEETTKTLTERTSAVKDLEKRLNEQVRSLKTHVHITVLGKLTMHRSCRPRTVCVCVCV